MSLPDHQWRTRYDRSRVASDGSLADPLEDFYLPALSESFQYDRETGYFTASSLSLAARGVQRFYENGGRIRLICGTQWNSDYTHLFLSQREKLTETLQAVLDARQWSEEEKEGMVWLCHFLREERLEVRLAMRETGTGDGYFHNKHGILTDKDGHQVAFEGSLNETLQGWSANSESIHVTCSWWDLNERERDTFAEIADGFERLWEDDHPEFKVRSLPDAVREKMIQIANDFPLPGEAEDPPSDTYVQPEADPDPMVTHEPAQEDFTELDRLLRAPYSADHPYAGSTLLPLNLWPHQKVAAWRLVSDYPKGFLLADEVGLGKTIEAASAARALWVQGKVRRILVCAPSSLCQQWQRELAYKFQMPFQLYQQNAHHRIWPEEARIPGQKLFEPDLAIVSHGLLRHPKQRKELEVMEPYDLVIIDEAHYLRRAHPDPQNASAVEVPPHYGKFYKTVEKYLAREGKARCLWLATATPIQLNFVEAWDLLRLLQRTGEFDADVALADQWYRWMEALQNGNSLEREWPYIQRLAENLETVDPEYHRWLRDHFLREKKRRWHYLTENWHRRLSANPKLRADLVQLLFYLAPLSRVMIRHSRRLLEVYRDHGFLRAGLAEREVVAIPPVERSPEESAVEAELKDYCKGLLEQIRKAAADTQNRRLANTLGFYLSFLRLRAASSLRALEKSMRNRLEKVEATLRHELSGPEVEEWMEEEATSGAGEEDTSHRVFLSNRREEDLRWEKRRIHKILRRLESLRRSHQDAKQLALLDILEERRVDATRFRPLVIFTRFLDTVWDVWERIAPLQLRVGVYSGAGGFINTNGRPEEVGREETSRRFVAQEIDILLCTDAAAEGLNLQVADTIVNLDMPWGPMKVEQRIGRIDRIGQKNPRVFVYNLRYKDSVEDVVYDRLHRRLREAELVTGHFSPSLLPIDEDDFRDLEEGQLTEEELAAKAESRMKEQRRFTEIRTFGPEEVFEIHRSLEEDNPLSAEEYTSRRAEQIVKGMEGFFQKRGNSWSFGGHEFSFDPNDRKNALVPGTSLWDSLLESRGMDPPPPEQPVNIVDSASRRFADRHKEDLEKSAEAFLQLYRRQFPEEEERKLLQKMEQQLHEGREIPNPNGSGWFTKINEVNGRLLVAWLRRKGG